MVLSARKSLVTETGTRISLVPGGIFKGYARKIVHQGNITVPSGEVVLETQSNSTTDEFFPVS
nr:hypothetical protein [Desulfobacula sp.]